MLRCPKCGRVYPDGTQRFCTNDGGRLSLEFDQLGGQQQETQQNPTGSLSRRTPPGELLEETFIAPFDNSNGESSSPGPLTNRTTAPLFQPFGLRSSSSPPETSCEKDATNGFHNFNSLVVGGGDATKSKQTEVVSSFSGMRQNRIDEEDVVYAKRKFGASFILISLLAALLFLTGLAFAAAYIVSEPPQAPAAATGENTTVMMRETKKADVLSAPD